MINKTLFAVFSYNRGEYLRNCIQSIEENFENCNIMIFDDNSNCLKTKNVLANLKGKYTVHLNESEQSGNIRKGLYDNMNNALEIAISNGYEYLFMIQEDIQIIRNSMSFINNDAKKIFDLDENIVQIVPTFFKSERGRDNNSTFKVEKNGQFYENNKINGICDIGLIKVEKLMNKGWHFSDSEPSNMKETTGYGWRNVRPRNPIMMYTPWPKTYRSANLLDKLLLIFTERYYKTGFYKYSTISDSKLKELCNRPISKIPVAEDYLETTESTKKPWVYSSSLTYFKIKISRFISRKKN